MERSPITEKKKEKRGLGFFLIILLILGFVAGVILFRMGVISPDQIPHP